MLRGLLTGSASFCALLSAAIVFVLNQYQSLRISPKLAAPFRRFAKYLLAGLISGVITSLISLAGLFDESTAVQHSFSLAAASVFAITLLVIVFAITKVYKEVTG